MRSRASSGDQSVILGFRNEPATAIAASRGAAIKNQELITLGELYRLGELQTSPKLRRYDHLNSHLDLLRRRAGTQAFASRVPRSPLRDASLHAARFGAETERDAHAPDAQHFVSFGASETTRVSKGG